MQQQCCIFVYYAYKQAKNYHPQVNAEGCKYIDKESQPYNMVSDSDDDDGCFEVYRRQIFCHLVEGYEKNKLAIRHCQSCFRKQRSSIYLVETV